MEKITEHAFRNQCMGPCSNCARDRNNRCSITLSDFSTCYKTREEHESCMEGHEQAKPSYTSN